MVPKPAFANHLNEKKDETEIDLELNVAVRVL
jgi:hypothetical protein